MGAGSPRRHLVGLAHAGVLVLTGDPHLGAQIARCDMEHVAADAVRHGSITPSEALPDPALSRRPGRATSAGARCEFDSKPDSGRSLARGALELVKAASAV